MRDNDGRKLDHQTLEALRIRAVRQIEEGAHPVAVADALGMRKSTVYGWLAKFREGGEAALKAKPVPGRQPKLDTRQMNVSTRLKSLGTVSDSAASTRSSRRRTAFR